MCVCIYGMFTVVCSHIKHTKYPVLAVDADACNNADNEYLKCLALDIAPFLYFQAHYQDIIA